MKRGETMNEKVIWIIKPDEEMAEIRKQAEHQFPKMVRQEELEDLSSFFKGLGDETRLRIISLLWLEDLCMCEITSALEIASSTLSHHLKIMEKGGIIQSRREGKFTVYSLAKQKVEKLLPFLMAGEQIV